jgi:hypothetical protein
MGTRGEGYAPSKVPRVRVQEREMEGDIRNGGDGGNRGKVASGIICPR